MVDFLRLLYEMQSVAAWYGNASHLELRREVRKCGGRGRRLGNWEAGNVIWEVNTFEAFATNSTDRRNSAIDGGVYCRGWRRCWLKLRSASDQRQDEEEGARGPPSSPGSLN